MFSVYFFLQIYRCSINLIFFFPYKMGDFDLIIGLRLGPNFFLTACTHPKLGGFTNIILNFQAFFNLFLLEKFPQIDSQIICLKFCKSLGWCTLESSPLWSPIPLFLIRKLPKKITLLHRIPSRDHGWLVCRIWKL